MELTIYNIKAEDTGRKAVLNDDVFAYTSGSDANPEHTLYLSIKQYLGNQRQGTHKSKERSEVSGSTRKLGRQKGGGGARHGDINSPLLRGGGRVFGPRPRDYRTKLNRKMKQLARKLALTDKAAKGQIIVVENFTFDAPRTRNYIDMAKAFDANNQKILLVMGGADSNVSLSVRNVPNALMMPAIDLNAYAILNNDRIIMTEESVQIINQF